MTTGRGTFLNSVRSAARSALYSLTFTRSDRARSADKLRASISIRLICNARGNHRQHMHVLTKDKAQSKSFSMDDARFGPPPSSRSPPLALCLAAALLAGNRSSVSLPGTSSIARSFGC